MILLIFNRKNFMNHNVVILTLCSILVAIQILNIILLYTR